jgi:hypothetical protein
VDSPNIFFQCVQLDRQTCKAYIEVKMHNTMLWKWLLALVKLFVLSFS